MVCIVSSTSFSVLEAHKLSFGLLSLILPSFAYSVDLVWEHTTMPVCLPVHLYATRTTITSFPTTGDFLWSDIDHHCSKPTPGHDSNPFTISMTHTPLEYDNNDDATNIYFGCPIKTPTFLLHMFHQPERLQQFVRPTKLVLGSHSLGVFTMSCRGSQMETGTTTRNRNRPI